MLSRIPNTKAPVTDLKGFCSQVWFRFFENLSPLVADAILDFPNTAAGATSDLTIVVKGATDGWPVSVGAPAASMPTNGSYSAFVSNQDEVTVRFSNTNTTAYNPASGKFTVTVTRL